jgi:signal transduction histidine kinase
MLVDFLVEQQLAGTVWLKLPLQMDRESIISRLETKGHLEQIYVCSLRADTTHLAAASSPTSYTVTTPVTDLVLESSGYLKREYFFIIISPQLQSLLLVQQHLEAEDKWQIIYTLSPEILQLILAQIQQNITITDRTPEALLKDNPLVETHTSQIQSSLVSALMLKHIQQVEESQKLIESPAKIDKNQSSILQLLHFQEELLKNFAQEISVPFTNIKTALRLLDSMQSKREQRQRYLELLERECEKQNALLSGIQEFLQLQQSTNLSSYPKLEDIIPGIVSTYQPLAEERGISLGCTIPEGFPPVACPEPWLRQILLNLLSNSLKFTSSNGRVYVQAALKQERVELTVSDTGRGIEMSDLPNIFNSFYRGKNLKSDQMNSAGLGLAVVKHLLNRCGGTIQVSSKPEKGTTVLLTLPVNEK